VSLAKIRNGSAARRARETSPREERSKADKNAITPTKMKIVTRPAILGGSWGGGRSQKDWREEGKRKRGGRGKGYSSTKTPEFNRHSEKTQNGSQRERSTVCDER